VARRTGRLSLLLSPLRSSRLLHFRPDIHRCYSSHRRNALTRCNRSQHQNTGAEFVSLSRIVSVRRFEKRCEITLKIVSRSCVRGDASAHLDPHARIASRCSLHIDPETPLASRLVTSLAGVSISMERLRMFLIPSTIIVDEIGDLITLF